MKTTMDDGFTHLTTFLADTDLDLEALDDERDTRMKTTPEGLTYLINMLVDVVNLQRKALGTPRANCDVEIGLEEVVGKVTVKLYADVDVAAPPLTTLSADNIRTSDEPLT